MDAPVWPAYQHCPAGRPCLFVCRRRRMCVCFLVTFLLGPERDSGLNACLSAHYCQSLSLSYVKGTPPEEAVALPYCGARGPRAAQECVKVP